jgi:hypothetical protein
MDADSTKDEAANNVGEDCTSGPVLGSARGLLFVDSGWDGPMSPAEVEEVFFPREDQNLALNLRGRS